jgi:hypothetical protein
MRGAEIMTDNQWRGMILMIMSIAEKCEDKEEIINELRKFLNPQDYKID